MFAVGPGFGTQVTAADNVLLAQPCFWDFCVWNDIIEETYSPHWGNYVSDKPWSRPLPLQLTMYVTAGNCRQRREVWAVRPHLSSHSKHVSCVQAVF